MTQAAATCINDAVIFGNPFALSDDSEFEKFFSDIYQNDDRNQENIWSNFISINKDYKRLNEAYQNVKKMANTYIENTVEESVLSKKLNRYLP